MEGKTPPAQVAQCQDHLGYKYRSGMQQPNTGSTRARSALWWCPCASCIWLLHPAPILVPKMVLTLCNLRWWCLYIYIYHSHHHHTVQVAMRAYSFVRTLVNALVLQGKTPPAQVAAGDDDHDCKWSIFASWWKEKHHQRKLHSVNTILGTSIGAGCSNQMQVAQGQDLH